MFRASLFIGLIASAVLPACAASNAPDDEFGQESAADGEDGKGDSAAAFTYYAVRPDNRACSLNSPGDCGVGFFVSRVNRSTTQCGRGSAQSECKALAIDWSGTAMPASVSKSYEERLENGDDSFVLRGALVPGADDRGTTLAVTEVWVGNTTEQADGVFALVHDNGIRCIHAPCPSLTELKLNSTLSAKITGIDSSETIDSAALFDAGLIIVGYRDYDSFGGKTRSANKYFTRAPVPLH
ncbi:MAG TPA: DUF6748 domain-containing protein [Kofleriaceae bacterium]|jgi:hypothetical protein|nr:DUF6748 domain-containing protein [Kofleriaceae bacterium]